MQVSGKKQLPDRRFDDTVRPSAVNHAFFESLFQSMRQTISSEGGFNQHLLSSLGSGSGTDHSSATGDGGSFSGGSKGGQGDLMATPLVRVGVIGDSSKHTANDDILTSTLEMLTSNKAQRQQLVTNFILGDLVAVSGALASARAASAKAEGKGSETNSGRKKRGGSERKETKSERRERLSRGGDDIASGVVAGGGGDDCSSQPKSTPPPKSAADRKISSSGGNSDNVNNVNDGVDNNDNNNSSNDDAGASSSKLDTQNLIPPLLFHLQSTIRNDCTSRLRRLESLRTLSSKKRSLLRSQLSNRRGLVKVNLEDCLLNVDVRDALYARKLGIQKEGSSRRLRELLFECLGEFEKARMR